MPRVFASVSVGLLNLRPVKVVRHICADAPARGKACGAVSHTALTSLKLPLLNLENRGAPCSSSSREYNRSGMTGTKWWSEMSIRPSRNLICDPLTVISITWVAHSYEQFDMEFEKAFKYYMFDMYVSECEMQEQKHKIQFFASNIWNTPQLSYNESCFKWYFILYAFVYSCHTSFL